MPLDFRFDLIGTPWSHDYEIPITQEQAIESALQNRLEIWVMGRLNLLNLE